MCINKKGFLLSDACVGIIIVSLCACIVLSVLISHNHSQETIQQAIENNEEQLEKGMERDMRCEDTLDMP